MAKQRIDAIIIQKIATLAEWNNIGRVPEKGEFMLIQNTASQPVNLKIGDGNRAFSALPNFIQYDQAAYVAPANWVLPAPQNGVGYSLLTEGSYNAGALVVPTGNLGVADYVGDSWVVRNMPLPTTPVTDQFGNSKTVAASQILPTLLNINKVESRVGKNKFNRLDLSIQDLKSLQADGAIVAHASRYVSEFIPVLPNTQYYLSVNDISPSYVAFYGSDMQFISSNQNRNFTTDAQTYFVRFSSQIASKNTQQMEVGSAFTIYEEYTQLNNLVGNSDLKTLSITDSKVASGAVSDRSIQLESVTPSKTSFFIQSVNKYNPEDMDRVVGRILNTSNGSLGTENNEFVTTGFIPVKSGQTIYGGNNQASATQSLRFVCFYNKDRVFVSGSQDQQRTQIVSPIDGYIRISFSTVSLPLYRVQLTPITAPYLPYAMGGLDPQYITIQDQSITPEKTNFFEYVSGTNLFNPNASDIVTGFVLNALGVPTTANAAWSTSGFFPVSEGDVIVIGNNGSLSSLRFIHIYDQNKARIAGGEDSSRQSYTVPTGAAFARVSYMNTWTLFQINKGSIKSYEPFRTEEVKLKSEYIPTLELQNEVDLLTEAVSSIRGESFESVKVASLAANTSLTMPNFPYDIKKNVSFSSEVYFQSFGGFMAGKGYMQFGGLYFEVNATNVICYVGSTGAHTIHQTLPHGLTMQDFAKLSGTIDVQGNANLVLFTKGAQVILPFVVPNNIQNVSFVRALEQPLTDVKLSFGCGDLMRPVWAFGDSYFGFFSSRWVGQMRTIGYLNIMVNGLSGGSSVGAYNDLLRCLEYGTPKYILWFLGMNDTNANYENTLNSLKVLCESRGITLILSTTPTVPTRSKEYIRNLVINSGYRYVDFYKSVGANSSGVWIDGYLSGDGVHPTTLGAQALANQVLVDFPEIMQYGKI